MTSFTVSVTTVCLTQLLTDDHAVYSNVFNSSQHVDRWFLPSCCLCSCPLTSAILFTRSSDKWSVAPAAWLTAMNKVHRAAQRQERAAAPSSRPARLVKVTDVTLDVVEAQDRTLVVVVAVLELLIRAATQLVLYHLRG